MKKGFRKFFWPILILADLAIAGTVFFLIWLQPDYSAAQKENSHLIGLSYMTMNNEFYKIMRELSAIGNRINQLAAKANALGFVDAPMLSQEAKKWHEFQVDVRKKYLLPQRQSG